MHYDPDKVMVFIFQIIAIHKLWIRKTEKLTYHEIHLGCNYRCFLLNLTYKIYYNLEKIKQLVSCTFVYAYRF